MQSKTFKIDLLKMVLYVLKRIWVVLICMAIGFGLLYSRTARKPDTYTAHGTMYIYNANPNIVNYGYTNTGDLNAAVQLLDTYMVVIRSNRVMEPVAEQLAADYPGITPQFIAASLSMGSVSQTGVMQVRCTTAEAQMSMDICNAVLSVAPYHIKEVVGAGDVQPIDFAEKPARPDANSPVQQGMLGAMIGGVLAVVLLAVLFLLNRKITEVKDLTDSYTPPVLSSIRRERRIGKDPGELLLGPQTKMEVSESYAKLRMNLFYTLVGRQNKVVMVTSSMAGEGKSTIAANLAISCALSGKRVILVDADMRRATQHELFQYSSDCLGLSDALVQNCTWQDALLPTVWENLSILPTGTLPPNPAELLGSEGMRTILEEMQQDCDLVLVDVPPINIVSDPLALSAYVAGCLFVTRQNYSDHRDIRRALISAELTGLSVLGFVFYGERLYQDGYASRKYYKNYYHQYERRYEQSTAAASAPPEGSEKNA